MPSAADARRIITRFDKKYSNLIDLQTLSRTGNKKARLALTNTIAGCSTQGQVPNPYVAR